jgi:hypothetical protein
MCQRRREANGQKKIVKEVQKKGSKKKERKKERINQT